MVPGDPPGFLPGGPAGIVRSSPGRGEWGPTPDPTGAVCGFTPFGPGGKGICRDFAQGWEKEGVYAGDSELPYLPEEIRDQGTRSSRGRVPGTGTRTGSGGRSREAAAKAIAAF